MHKKFRQIPLWVGLLGFLSVSICGAQDYPILNTSPQMEAVNAALDAFEPASSQTPQKSSQPSIQKKADNSMATQMPYYMSESSSPSVVKDSNKIFQNVKVTGEIRSSVGVYSDGHTVFTRANGNLTERDYHLLSFDALSRKENTYDPNLYSRLKVVTDAALTNAISMHLNISIDPWSFTGKSKDQIVNGVGGDSIKLQYLYWGNTGYTVNQIVTTLQNGDGFALPEIKVNKKNMVPATTINSTFGNIFNLPETKINYTFQPIREAWFDIKPENDATIRIFPMAFQNQALASDDPLKLSNNMEWWAESPWIDDWHPGHLNTPPGSQDFSRGYWDRSLAYLTRDSDLQRLTALRGISLKIHPDRDNSLEATVASPKTLWQDYDEITAVPASVRAKHYIDDTAYVGTIANAHQGYNSRHKDAENYTGGVDAGYTPFKWLMVDGEWSTSKSRYDETTSSYATKMHGNAYYASLISTSNPEEMIRKDYFGIVPVEKTDTFYKTRLYFSRMDQDFESTLSQYHETRDDSLWSRNLTFYPNTYRFLPGISPNISEDDLSSFAIGNGIDYGRSVVGWRGDTNLMQGKVHGLVDFRRVWDNSTKSDLLNGKRNIESVARTQWSLQATDKLVTRALLLWHALPKTTQGIDPFITDGSSSVPLINTAVTGGKDPSLKTASLGARYELTSWANISEVWTYTNDFTLSSNNFPRGVLNSSSFVVNNIDGRDYRSPIPFLYDQTYFRQPPYQYHNIFKSGLELIPTEAWHIYMDYTVNPNKFAGNIDDNMNHFGLETSFVSNKKIGFFARYTFSKWYDLDRLVFNNELKYKGYNNLFFETRLILPADSTLSLQYGVGPGYNIKTQYEDPNLNYYLNPTLTTQHVVRLTCEKKF
jgi:hypothetical protein